ncbi:hypothetical protein [Bosea sp. (in: a-proteobacteria)]|uniref:hypothetical protein n=1 Tax=Bosea sp. (in: a-proteobacteria) TaxID=1871050 RepID=UPI0027365A59|nr:hypothetical protein [Bosea sp. (in: a-proteobacteria)]MDP3410377.1 hypothetical protein [Bosea sp. (in: a-proteobacteria)]
MSAARVCAVVSLAYAILFQAILGSLNLASARAPSPLDQALMVLCSSSGTPTGDQTHADHALPCCLPLQRAAFDAPLTTIATIEWMPSRHRTSTAIRFRSAALQRAPPDVPESPPPSRAPPSLA